MLKEVVLRQFVVQWEACDILGMWNTGGVFFFEGVYSWF